MSLDLTLHCPVCATTALADDEFCESCGAALSGPRDTARNHIEIDAGRAAGVSDRGLVHRRNEDALHVWAAGSSAVLVVCDGVSTAAAPQIAAQVAADVAGRALVAWLGDRASARGEPEDAEVAMAAAIAAADRAVLDVPWMPSQDRDAPSCTIVAAVWEGSAVTIGWTGDSRAYWIGDHGGESLTSDHSWVQEQVDAGLLSRDAAEADRRAHAITRWLGAHAPAGSAPTRVLHPTGPGRLILCSDGLWNYAPTGEGLAALVAACPRPGPTVELARALVRAAISRGGHDNVTVAVLDVASPGATD